MQVNVSSSKQNPFLFAKSLIKISSEKFSEVKFKITPLYGSLNPTDYADRLSTIAQIHFIGREDSIIPKSVLLSYKEKIHGDEKTVKIVPIKGADHTCCWEKVWRDLLEAYVNN